MIVLSSENVKSYIWEKIVPRISLSYRRLDFGLVQTHIAYIIYNSDRVHYYLDLTCRSLLWYINSARHWRVITELSLIFRNVVKADTCWIWKSRLDPMDQEVRKEVRDENGGDKTEHLGNITERDDDVITRYRYFGSQTFEWETCNSIGNINATKHRNVLYGNGRLLHLLIYQFDVVTMYRVSSSGI